MLASRYNWHQIHMFPEESMQAGIDTGVKTMMSVHWGAFALALHHWQDPVERFVAEAEKRNSNFIIPRLGEIVSSTSSSFPKWWMKTESDN